MINKKFLGIINLGIVYKLGNKLIRASKKNLQREVNKNRIGLNNLRTQLNRNNLLLEILEKIQKLCNRSKKSS